MIAAIENAILASLRDAAQSGLLGYQWRALETYPEDWDQYLKDKVNLRAPAAWATFGGWGVPDGDARMPRLPATFGLVVMGESLRNEQASRHGDPANPGQPGSYQLALDAAQLLHGQTFGLDIDAIRVGSCRFVRSMPARRQQGASMLAIELRTAFALEPLSGQLDAFAKWHANWDSRPFVPIASVPADAQADATDHVLLETAP